MTRSVYLSASALAGIARFLLLRLVVFTTPTPTTPLHLHPPLALTA
ncbi:hypothetical protein ACWD4O_08255 [Streptomyces sp. NPDC002623]